MQKEIIDKVFSKTLFLVLMGVLIFTICSKSVAGNCDLSNSIEVINKYMPGYKLITIDEYDSYTKKYFELHYPDKNPAIVCADFDGNGFVDLAVLIRDSSRKNSLVFVILLQFANSKYVLNYKSDIGRDYCDLYITEVKPGEILTPFGSSDPVKNSIILKKYAINLVCFGKTDVVHYWDDKKKQFDSIQTAD